MPTLFQSQSRSFWLLPVVLLLMVGCVAASTNENQVKVLWKGSRDYDQSVDSFKIKPGEASKMVLAEMKKPGALKLRAGGIFAEAEFTVGGWYWFGIATKTEIYVGGFYVNGDTGKMEYRESDLVLTSHVAKLPKDVWSKVTPLPQ